MGRDMLSSCPPRHEGLHRVCVLTFPNWDFCFQEEKASKEHAVINSFLNLPKFFPVGFK